MNDFVECLIIGSGPGATVYAKRFSDIGLDYLVFEKSNFYLQSDIDPYSDIDLKLRYQNQGITASIGNVIVNYAEGSTVGGGSEVNSGLYHRLPNNIIEYWSQELGRDLTLEGIAESEIFIEGLLNVTPVLDVNDLACRLINGSSSLGWDYVNVPRWIKGGVKQSMTEVFYRHNSTRLKVGCEVLSFKKSNSDIFIVKYRENGLVKYINCKNIFLGAGSISSPILMLNSLASPSIFSRINGLMMHPSIKVLADFGEILSGRDEVPNIQIKEFSPSITLGCSISTEPYIGLFLSSAGKLEYLSSFENMAIYYGMLSTKTSGSIIKIPFSDPIITYNLSKSDLENLRGALLKLGMLIFKSGAKRILIGKKDSEWFESYEDFNLGVNNLVMSKCDFMTIHLFGSLKMSSNYSKYGFNPFGESWSIPNLYICDSSMLPSSPTVNPQGPLMVMADLNCKKFLTLNNYDF